MDGLVIAGLHKSFGDVKAVNDLNLHVPVGALVGFLGPNGAGKTTTMRAVVGMVRPDAGTIHWNGRTISPSDRRRIGYMPQERGLYARMKVREQVTYFGQLAGLSREEAGRRTDYWLERVELSDRADSLVQELSGGNQQRVQLAVSLVHDPMLLILDEPFAGLDPVAAETMRSIIADRTDAGASVLFSSHQLDLVEDLCSKVVVASKGAVVATGDIEDLRSASARRQLRVRWAHPVASWQPLNGEVVSFDERSTVVEIAATADLSAHIAHALTAGPVDSVSLEPPELSEIFAELVEGLPL